MERRWKVWQIVGYAACIYAAVGPRTGVSQQWRKSRYVSDASRPVNILLVDDRPDNLLVLEAVLAPLGYHLVKAGSGREALRLLLDLEFAVILLDVHMPEMDGFETAALIRSRSRLQVTPIIFLTAVNTTERDSERGYQLGAIDYMLKPFDPDVLRARVHALVALFQRIEDERADLLERERTARLEAEAALRMRDEF